MFEIFLFINPIGIYCYNTEKQIRKTVCPCDRGPCARLQTGQAPPPPVNSLSLRKERNEYVYCPEHQRCHPGKLPVPV